MSHRNILKKDVKSKKTLCNESNNSLHTTGRLKWKDFYTFFSLGNLLLFVLTIGGGAVCSLIGAGVGTGLGLAFGTFAGAVVGYKIGVYGGWAIGMLVGYKIGSFVKKKTFDPNKNKELFEESVTQFDFEKKTHEKQIKE